MVLQYRLKGDSRWRKYPGKDKMKVALSKCQFRLLNEAKTIVLSGPGTYASVFKRFRQIEFFKHRRGR